MSEDTISEQTVQTAEDTQVQDTQVADTVNEDGSLRPIDHQIISRLKDVEKALKKPSSSQTTSQTNQSSSESERDLIVDLRLEGYSKSEADFILRNGGRQALEDPLVKGAIETARSKTKSLDATPSGTGKSTTLKGYSETAVRNMSAAEMIEKGIVS